MKFYDDKHEQFYEENILRCIHDDTYHRALVYLLGLTEDTRNHIESIFDFRADCVKHECLRSAWITSSNARIIRFAFNLYNCGAPSCWNLEGEDKFSEAKEYFPTSFFHCDFAPYYWEALKIRYPHTCYEL